MTMTIKVLRKDIERGHIETYVKKIETAEKKKDKLRSNVILHFEGYENEERPMHKVPEFQKWVQRLIKKKPHIFYYLNNYKPYFLRSVLLCMIEQSNPSYDLLPAGLRSYVSSEIDPGKLQDEIQKKMKSALIYSEKLHDDLHDQNILREYILYHTGYYLLDLEN